jgi:hypothetical protein
MLKFDFPGILLPDSGTNNEQSMGFVQNSSAHLPLWCRAIQSETKP